MTMGKETDEIVILYVEDEEDDIFFMRRAFDKEGMAESFRCVVDGGEAIAYLEGAEAFADRGAHPLPKLILLDLNLPVRSGFQVLEWIRSQEHTEGIPVVIFSSSGHKNDRNRATELGANAYIQKPSSGLAFSETVRTLKRDWLTKTKGP